MIFCCTPCHRFVNGRIVTRESGLPITLIAHSHSGSQFLPHLPAHSKSVMPPPHCGQTRLMIDDITVALVSPGIVSMILIVACTRLQQVPLAEEFVRAIVDCRLARCLTLQT